MTVKPRTSLCALALLALMPCGAAAAAQAEAAPQDAPTDMRTLWASLWQDAQSWYANVDFAALAISCAAAAAIFLVVYLGLSLGLRTISARLNTAGERSDREGGYLSRARSAATLAGHVLQRTSGLFILITALHASGFALALPEAVRNLSHSIFIIAFVIQCALWATALATQWLEGVAAQRAGEHRAISGATTIIGLIVRTALWSLALMLILDNLGFDITALVAGLGVGGIAIGLAAQNILGDLFASLSIVLDKPFEIGDFIISGDYMGTVERIGLKTTRLRSLSGEQVVISNADLLTSRVRNYKRMAERRVVFAVGVTYGTPADSLQKIPKIIREAIESQEKTRFDRSNFVAYGDFSLNFETVYYILSREYNLYADIHEAILLAIYRRFADEKIDFAFPTQSIHVERFPSHPPEQNGAEGSPAQDT